MNPEKIKTLNSGNLVVRYSLVADTYPLPTGEVDCFGIRLEAMTARGKERKEFRNITPLPGEAEALLDALWRNGVTPVSLSEVLEDCLGEEKPRQKRNFLV